MTNLQLLLSIGIPSLLIVLSCLQQSSRIGRLEPALDRHSDSVDSGLQMVADKFDAIRTEMVALRDSIHRDMITLHERVAFVEAKQG